jgi:uncharacterized protein YjdB
MSGRSVRSAAALLCSSALFALGCSGGATDSGGASGAVQTVELSARVLQLRVGAEGALVARLLDAGGAEVPGRRVFWSVADSTVATVSQAGVVRAVGPGSTRVAANIEGRSAAADVVVGARPVSLVRVDPGTLQLVVGATAALSARALDELGAEVPGATLRWSTSDTAVAPVSATGLVTARAPGLAVLTATAEGRSAVVAVAVSPVAVAAVTLSAARDTLAAGASTQLTLTVRDAAGQPLSNRPVSYGSSAPAVATISSTGEVSALAPGTVTLTATVEGQRAAVGLTVVPRPAAAVVVSPDASTLFVGGTQRLLVLVTDAQGAVLTGRAVGYTSSAPAVATVDGTGTVRALAPGTATLTASTPEGQRGTATVRVVAVPVATLALTAAGAPAEGLVTLRVGEGRQLGATPLAEDGTALPERAVTWTSAAPGVASVTSAGRVVGVAPGTALLLARAEGASATLSVRVEPAPVGTAPAPAAPTPPTRARSSAGTRAPPAPTPTQHRTDAHPSSSSSASASADASTSAGTGTDGACPDDRQAFAGDRGRALRRSDPVPCRGLRRRRQADEHRRTAGRVPDVERARALAPRRWERRRPRPRDRDRDRDRRRQERHRLGHRAT